MSDGEAHRLLITGANGFVGTALVERLQNDDRFDVVCAVRTDGRTRAETRQYVVGDIGRDTQWASALEGVHTVVHLAARVHVMQERSANPLAAFRSVNVEGTRALAVQAANAGVKRLIFLSSIKVNGESGLFSERDLPHPTDAYGISKLEAELALQAIAASTGLEVVIVRPPLVYGPGVKANFRMLLKLVETGIPLPFGAVENKRSFVAVQNLADFILHCAQHPRALNETFLVSDGDDLSTPELVRRMARALGRRARLLPMPVSLLNGVASMTGQRAAIDRLLGSLQLDITKARQQLGWAPPLSVDDALRLAVASR